jgi:hypothetical protein
MEPITFKEAIRLATREITITNPSRAKEFIQKNFKIISLMVKSNITEETFTTYIRKIINHNFAK